MIFLVLVHYPQIMLLQTKLPNLFTVFIFQMVRKNSRKEHTLNNHHTRTQTIRRHINYLTSEFRLLYPASLKRRQDYPSKFIFYRVILINSKVFVNRTFHPTYMRDMFYNKIIKYTNDILSQILNDFVNTFCIFYFETISLSLTL